MFKKSILTKQKKGFRRNKKMKKLLIIMISGMFLFSGLVFAGEKAPQKVVDLAHSKLVKLGEDPLTWLR